MLLRLGNLVVQSVVHLIVVAMPLLGDSGEVSIDHIEVGQEIGHTAIEHRVDRIGSHIAHRYQDESSFMLTWMRDVQLGGVDDGVSVHEEIKVEGAGPPPDAPHSVPVGFNAMQVGQQVGSIAGGGDAQSRIQIWALLFWAADGCGFVKGGYGSDLHAVKACDGCDTGTEVVDTVAKV